MGYPFQKFELDVTKNIDNKITLIFGKQNVCIIDSIILVNSSSVKPVLINMYILRENEQQEAVRYQLITDLSIDNNQSIDFMYNKKALYINSGDTIFAYSDYSNNLFNTFISYRELTELA